MVCYLIVNSSSIERKTESTEIEICKEKCSTKWIPGRSMLLFTRLNGHVPDNVPMNLNHIQYGHSHPISRSIYNSPYLRSCVGTTVAYSSEKKVV